MRLRLTKIAEFQFLTCFKYQVWGSKRDSFKDWKIGDYLAFQVDKALAGLAQITNEPYYSKEVVWDHGLYPHRIPIKFLIVALPENRLPLLGPIRDALISAWGTKYGWGILNQVALPEVESKKILDAIQAGKNDVDEVLKNLATYLIQAKAHQEAFSENKIRQHLEKHENEYSSSPELPPPKEFIHSPELPSPEIISAKEDSLHSKAQSLLIRLGKITKCSIWVASNDKNKTFMGEKLVRDCLPSLPNLGLTEEATKRIKLIDVIWLHLKAPICAFEVEATTLIYSGLLRLSDLISVIPAINIQLFIVAPREKQQKVMEELSRPTFQKIGLNDYCRFISIEELESLLSKVEGLSGYVSPNILDTISIALDNDFESGMG
jgi:hypothetical protein